ncbi:formylglycine-generating enzyme family protein [Lunatibacter salilacus]|uniref:formylglycine-generating enzyme family protein n=1 Tax=Lunatibacter salilacus TaxID=2483804 RepID=UPI00131E0811|nr:formylglycine-generating enzyme family protein [Lunatibacter salilacus]
MGKLLAFWLCTLLASYTSAQHVEMVLVNEGIYTPLYGSAEEGQVSVSAFYMDVIPVSHGDFLEFVREFPQWQKGNVIKLFADERYLDNWTGTTSFPEYLKDKPVNNVSWFAAKAYCECRGKRLPTVDEWEFAAMASEDKADARRDSLYNVGILRSYEKPKTYLTSVGQSPKNYWGVKDLHGLVWEWTLDFNSIIITGESRNNGNTDRGLFCASGAVGASDLMNYAAFMRYALRSSLKANYSLTNLGFRCVADTENYDLITKK